jgi:hypothetical protein
MKKKLWFKAKWFGWGWYPVTWEGWLVTLLGTGVYVLSFVYMDLESLTDLQISIWSLISFSGLLFYFLFWGYTFGEEPRWRWGKN